MQTGALIVAAGKSSRMGDFKPMLQLGSISIAQRVINNFRQAGISKVVVVTGYHADVLECHLASNNVVFLRNENYANTHMFDSVRIGLEYLKDKVDTVLFTPVDVPLFTERSSFLSEDILHIMNILRYQIFAPAGTMSTFQQDTRGFPCFRRSCRLHLFHTWKLPDSPHVRFPPSPGSLRLLPKLLHLYSIHKIPDLQIRHRNADPHSNLPSGKNSVTTV